MKKTTLDQINLILGPVSAVIACILLVSNNWSIATAGMVATTVLMCIWWVTTPIPLAATSLLPILAFPIFGIESMNDTASRYSNSLVMLLIGGYLIAQAIERSNLHRRIALTIIKLLGAKPGRIIIAFMATSAFLSMWISNTATSVMMVAIGVTLLDALDITTDTKEGKALSLAVMFGIAYGCSIGGISTLIGTPTNLVLLSVMSEIFPGEAQISFGQWILFGLPISLGMLLILWFTLTRVFYRPLHQINLKSITAQNALDDIKPWTSGEKRVAIIFVLTGLLWVFRRDLVLGPVTIPGWGSLWEPLSQINDGMVAIFMALILFILPAGKDKPGERLLVEDSIKKMPWPILLLFGGGFAMAGGFVESGLTEKLAQAFQQLEGTPTPVIIGLSCLGMTFLTEFTSNVGSASIVLPILASLSDGLQIAPYTLLLPVTLSASMAFMMPVATPPNAIVFSSGRVTVSEMVKIGFVLNLLAVVWVFASTQILLPIVWLN